jgi:glutamate carboxypeptidase
MANTAVYEQLNAHLQGHEADYLNLLKQWVEINSFTANAAGVNKLGEVTAATFARLGFTAETVQAENPLYGKHLLLTRHGSGRHKIGFVSHQDTVFPAEEEVQNDFRWRREGKRIYGPGTVDIKGGTVMMFMVLDALKAVLPELFEQITWLVMLNACEEVDEDDFGRLCAARLGQDALACLVFEAGHMHGRTFQMVTARKGMAQYQVEVEGKASHAGSAHDKGANAIVQLAEVIRHIHRFTDYENNLTFNVGTVMGGTVTNRVPHFAAAGVEMRAFDPAVYQQGITHMLALNELSNVGSANGDFACRVNVQITGQSQPWPINEATDRLLAIWQETGTELGFTVKREERGGLSDGNHLWAHVPTLDGLGPSGGNAHCSERSADGSKDQEYVFVPSFVPKALLNTAAILKMPGHSSLVAGG